MLHTHGTEGLRELNGNRRAMRIHLVEQHGPWPLELNWDKVDSGVMRQLHQAAGGHARSQAERAARAGEIARDAATHAFRDGLQPGAVTYTATGGQFVLSDGTERYMVEVKSLGGLS